MKLLPLAPKILRLIRYILSQFLTPLAPPRGRNMVFRKMHFGWVRFHIEISKVTGPNFTVLVSPNAGRIAKDGMTIRFWISSSVSEIFAAELRSHPKSGQILHVFCPRNFFGVPPPKILDRHFKIQPSTDHRAKFQAGRPTHLGDLALGKKHLQ